MCANAAWVTPGNEYLAAFARRFTPNVTVIPTVIDTDRYAVAPQRPAGAPVRVGWSGSDQSITAALFPSLPMLDGAPGAARLRVRHRHEHAADAPGFRASIHVRAMEGGGGRRAGPPHGRRSDAARRRRLPAREVRAEAASVHGGRTPAVASPVGVNADIVIRGETGFLAERDGGLGRGPRGTRTLCRPPQLDGPTGAPPLRRTLLDSAMAAGTDRDPDSSRFGPTGEGEPGRMSPEKMERLPGWRRAAKLEKRLPDCVLLVPTFRRPREMTVLLERLATLPDPPGEVLIVDGSGDDLTDNAVAAWSGGRELPFDLALVRSPAGLTRQRNVGVDASQAAYVYFLDDDCLPEPGYFAAIRRVFGDDRERTVGAVCGSLLNEMGRPLSRRSRLRLRLGLVPRDGRPGVYYPTATSVPGALSSLFRASAQWTSFRAAPWPGGARSSRRIGSRSSSTAMPRVKMSRCRGVSHDRGRSSGVGMLT